MSLFIAAHSTRPPSCEARLGGNRPFLVSEVRIPPVGILFIKLHTEMLNRCRSSSAIVLSQYRVIYPYYTPSSGGSLSLTAFTEL
jgi:hypothetical protein